MVGTLSIQKSSTNQTTPFKVWWCIDFLIVADNVSLSDLFPKSKTEVWRISDASELDFLAVSRIIDEIDKKVKEFVAQLKTHR